MEKKEFRSITLEEFPGYDVRLVYASRVMRGKPQNISRYGFYSRYCGITEKPMMLIKSPRKMADAAGMPNEGDKLKVDSSASIPSTLLKPRYKILTSRSPQSPDYIVLGNVDFSNIYSFRVFVCEQLKQVICVYEYNRLSKDYDDSPDLDDYKTLLREIDEFYYNADSFHPYSSDYFDTFRLIKYSKGLWDFHNRMLPDTSFVHEEQLVTGTKPVTPELLYSCMSMMDSTDYEMQDSALLTLASSDYSKCRNVVGYLMSRYNIDVVKRLKNKSTAVKWMARMCRIERWTSFIFTKEEADFAKDYLEVSSRGLVSYSGESRRIMLCVDANFLVRNHDFIKKIPGLIYDLETANVIAQAL